MVFDSGSVGNDWNVIHGDVRNISPRDEPSRETSCRGLAYVVVNDATRALSSSFCGREASSMSILFRHPTVRWCWTAVAVFFTCFFLVGGTASAKCLQFYSGGKCFRAEIDTGTAEVEAILENGSYTPDGSGPAVYAWMSQTCPISKAFFRERSRFSGVQFRYYPFPTVRDNPNEFVQVMMSRSPTDFYSYMNQTLPAPAEQSDPARVAMLNRLIKNTDRLTAIMHQNGMNWKNIPTPSWFWFGSGPSANGTGERAILYWMTGYNAQNTNSMISALGVKSNDNNSTK
jgi:hypothetical protein